MRSRVSNAVREKRARGAAPFARALNVAANSAAAFTAAAARRSLLPLLYESESCVFEEWRRATAAGRKVASLWLPDFQNVTNDARSSFGARGTPRAVALQERLDRFRPRGGRKVLRYGVQVCERGVLVDERAHLGVERGPTGSECGGGLVVRRAREVDIKANAFADERDTELQLAHNTCASVCWLRCK
eukprot:3573867-Prymnesium_polylepis.2